MMNKGLGRGLSALIPGNMTPGNGERKKDGMTVLVPISSVRPNVRQPRKTISQDSLEELAASIRSQGIIQPLIVRETGTPGSYEIIAGERRWRAARLAGLREVPVLVRSMSDEDVMIVALVENLQRKDLNPAEEARAIQELKDKLSLTQEDLAKKLGKSRSRIANSLRLLQLPGEALTSLEKGAISAGHARCLLSVADDAQACRILLGHMLKDRLSVRASEDAVSTWKKTGHMPWNETETAVPPARPAPARRSGEFRQIEQHLSTLLHCRTRISGTPQKGRVSLAYKSEDELLRILSALGLDGRASGEAGTETGSGADGTAGEEENKG